MPTFATKTLKYCNFASSPYLSRSPRQNVLVTSHFLYSYGAHFRNEKNTVLPRRLDCCKTALIQIVSVCRGALVPESLYGNPCTLLVATERRKCKHPRRVAMFRTYLYIRSVKKHTTVRCTNELLLFLLLLRNSRRGHFETPTFVNCVFHTTLP